MAFVAIVPLLWAMQEARPRRGLLLGAAFGCAFFGATLYWIWLFGFMAWSVLVLMSSAFIAVAIWAWTFLRRPMPALIEAGAFASLWVVLEWLRSMYPLGGF